MLRKIFGSRREEVGLTGVWRRLRNEDLHCYNSSPYTDKVIKSRRMKWAGREARMGEMRNAYKLWSGKTGENRSLGRLRRR
jgi:hypothetical protein